MRHFVNSWFHPKKLIRAIKIIKPSLSLQLIFIGILMLLDRFRGKKIIIIDLEEITFIPYILPIIEALKLKSFKISYYIATNHIYFGAEDLRPFNVFRRKHFHISLSSKFYLTDLFLSAHIQGKGNKKSIRVMVSHNLPVKWKSFPKDNFINYDAHFLSGTLNREMVELTIKKHKLEKSNIRLLNIGYCKSDKLFRGEYNKKQILIELGLNPNNPTILYSPSWDDGLSLRMFGQSIIEKMLNIENINLIVKLHPVSYTSYEHPNYDFYTGGIDWIEKLSKFESNGNYKHVKSINNINPLLEASDVMVTDLSSVALEFIIIDKPVIYFECKSFFDNTIKKVYLEFDSTPEYVKNHSSTNAGRNVGLVIKDVNELPEVIQRCLDKPNEFSKERKKLSKQLLYNAGQGAEMGANAILGLLQL